MDTAKIFTSGRSQAVRLPRPYRFEGSEVCVAKLDDMVILYPRDKGWDILEHSFSRFTDDYMRDRDQPEAPGERPGL